MAKSCTKCRSVLYGHIDAEAVCTELVATMYRVLNSASQANSRSLRAAKLCQSPLELMGAKGTQHFAGSGSLLPLTSVTAEE